MKATSFEGQNIIIAENQKEYLPLPAFVQESGIVTFCMELDDEEVESIVKDKEVKLQFLNFAGPVQPVCVSIIKPKFPISAQAGFNCSAYAWADKNRVAKLKFGVRPEQFLVLRNHKKLWISIATFGSPMQPIATMLSPE